MFILSVVTFIIISPFCVWNKERVGLGGGGGEEEVALVAAVVLAAVVLAAFLAVAASVGGGGEGGSQGGGLFGGGFLGSGIGPVVARVVVKAAAALPSLTAYEVLPLPSPSLVPPLGCRQVFRMEKSRWRTLEIPH